MKYTIYALNDKFGFIPLQIEGVAVHNEKTGITIIYDNACDRNIVAVVPKDGFLIKEG